MAPSMESSSGSISNTLSQARTESQRLDKCNQPQTPINDPALPGSPGVRPSIAQRSQTSMGFSRSYLNGNLEPLLSSPNVKRSPMSRWPKQSQGTVSVSSPDVFNDLFPPQRPKRGTKSIGSGDATDMWTETLTLMTQKTTKTDSQAGLKAKAAARSAEMRRLMGVKDAKIQHELRRDIHNRMVRDNNKARKEQEKRLKAIEDEQSTFVAEVDHFLERKSEEDKLAQKTLLNAWTEQVYKKIERQISKVVEDRDRKALSTRLQQLYEECLAASGRCTVFRDIIVESEYNPFESKKDTIKVEAKPRTRHYPEGMVDPLAEQIDKVLEIHEGKLHLLKSGGRDLSALPVMNWDTVSSTPIGFAARDLEASLRPADPNAHLRGRVIRNKSDEMTAANDHYTFVRGEEGSAVSKAEQPMGKKCFPGWAAGGKQIGLADWRPPFAVVTDGKDKAKTDKNGLPKKHKESEFFD